MKKKPQRDVFVKLCQEAFRFLEERYGCAAPLSTTDRYGSYVTYRQPTIAIRISLEPREGGVFIRFYRLIDGKMPDYPVFIEQNQRLHIFYLDDLVKLRAPMETIIRSPFELFNSDGLNVPLLRAILVQYAALLEKNASDVLHGNLTVFDSLEDIVKERAKKLRKNRRRPK